MSRFEESNDLATPLRAASTDRELDPGAYIGQQPELASETIPGGVRPEDDRVAFNASQRAVDGEPGTDEPGTDDPGMDAPGKDQPAMDAPADAPAPQEAGQDL